MKSDSHCSTYGRMCWPERFAQAPHFAYIPLTWKQKHPTELFAHSLLCVVSSSRKRNGAKYFWRPSQRWFRIYKQYARHWHVNSPVAAAGVASAATSLNRRLAGARRLGSTHNPANFNCFEDRNSHQSSKKCAWKSTYWNIFSTSKKTFVKQPRNETINVR